MKQPQWMYRRQWSVTHGRDGFQLWVRDEWIPYLLAEGITNGVMAVLGHPCCGRGLLGRISSDAIDLFWFRAINLSCGLYRFGKQVITIPLSPDQALTLSPHWRDEDWITIDGVDDLGNEWRGGVLVREAELAERMEAQRTVLSPEAFDALYGDLDEPPVKNERLAHASKRAEAILIRDDDLLLAAALERTVRDSGKRYTLEEVAAECGIDLDTDRGD